MTPTDFTRGAQKLGLARPYCSQHAATVLRDLIVTPEPVIAKTHSHQRSDSPSAIPIMGKLIRAGLAELSADRSCYEATSEGEAWIESLTKHGLL